MTFVSTLLKEIEEHELEQFRSIARVEIDHEIDRIFGGKKRVLLPDQIVLGSDSKDYTQSLYFQTIQALLERGAIGRDGKRETTRFNPENFETIQIEQAFHNPKTGETGTKWTQTTSMRYLQRIMQQLVKNSEDSRVPVGQPDQDWDELTHGVHWKPTKKVFMVRHSEVSPALLLRYWERLLYNQRLGATEVYRAIVSREIVDLVRISNFPETGVGSCMRPPKPSQNIEAGINYDKVPEFVKYGLVVYLVKEADLKSVDLDAPEIFEDDDRGVKGIQPYGRVKIAFVFDLYRAQKTPHSSRYTAALKSNQGKVEFDHQLITNKMCITRYSPDAFYGDSVVPSVRNKFVQIVTDYFGGVVPRAKFSAPHYADNYDVVSKVPTMKNVFSDYQGFEVTEDNRINLGKGRDQIDSLFYYIVLKVLHPEIECKLADDGNVWFVSGHVENLKAFLRNAEKFRTRSLQSKLITIRRASGDMLHDINPRIIFRLKDFKDFDFVNTQHLTEEKAKIAECFFRDSSFEDFRYELHGDQVIVEHDGDLVGFLAKLNAINYAYHVSEYKVQV